MKFTWTIILLLSLARPASGQDRVKWVFTDYPPANFQTEAGRFDGFLHDMVLEVFNRGLGMDVDIAVFPWKRCQRMVKTGSADIMVTVPTKKRLEYTLTHKRPVWTKRRILYTYQGHPEINKIQNINGLDAIFNGGYSVISYLGNGWTTREIEGNGIAVVYATTVDGMYRMLAGKRGDLIIEEKNLAAPRIIKQDLSGKIVETRGIGSKSGFHILISKKSAYASLVSRVDREVEAMRHDGRLNQILANYGIPAAQ